MNEQVEQLNAIGRGYLPGLIGLEITAVEPGRVESRLELRPELMAPNGYLHAATLIALTDTSCGYGTRSNLPAGAVNFTTIEVKCNFLATAHEGTILCTATALHMGRTTQIWDAVVTDPQRDRTLALFRCTQIIIYPRGA
jgi:1,4-dihydroxy-2-naphthoyl-CoA hydrolase